VGSAFGPGGLVGRITHHLGLTPRPHWHIDFLRSHAVPKEIWIGLQEIRQEHIWADLLRRARYARQPVAGFGSSDCRCYSHLFHFPKKPPMMKICESVDGALTKRAQIAKIPVSPGSIMP
jgi:Uri superfamily endonuclease